MRREIIFFFILFTFSESVDPSTTGAATTNDTILELYKLLRNTEHPSLKEVDAIKSSDTIRSYFGHVTGE